MRKLDIPYRMVDVNKKHCVSGGESVDGGCDTKKCVSGGQYVKPNSG